MMTLDTVRAVLVLVAGALGIWLSGRVLRQFGAFTAAYVKDRVNKQQLVKVIAWYDEQLSCKEHAA